MRRRSKLLVALLLISASTGLILWQTQAAGAPAALGVSDAKWQAESLSGEEVSVRGNVVAGTIVEDGPRVVSFIVADAQEQLYVFYNQTPPDSFGAKEVVVKGTMSVDAEGVPVLQAGSIFVGCASKY